MHNTTKHRWMILLVVAAALLAGSMAQADVVTDWNITAGDIAVAAKLPPPAYRVMAMVQSAVYEAVNAITKRYPPERVKLDAASGASVEAAVARRRLEPEASARANWPQCRAVSLGWRTMRVASLRTRCAIVCRPGRVTRLFTSFSLRSSRRR